MHEFNKYGNVPPNVLWLSDAERADGARFTHSLGSNPLVADWTAVNKMGRVSHRSARAALRFISSIQPSLVPEDVDLSDSPKPEKRNQPSSSSAAPNLHEVRHGKVNKNHYGQAHKNDNRGNYSS